MSGLRHGRWDQNPVARFMTSGMLKVWIDAQPEIFSLNSAAVMTENSPADASPACDFAAAM